MTKEQQIITHNLGQVTIQSGTFDKRFRNSMTAILESNPDAEISEKQIEWLYRLLYKYRRQIPKTYERYKDNKFCRPIKKVA